MFSQHNGFSVKLGGSIGSPIPIGNIPDGASGSPTVGLLAGVAFEILLNTPWSLITELQYVHYGSTFSTPLEDHPYLDKVPVQTPDGSQVILEVNTTFTGTATGAFSNDYIQLPLLVGYCANESLELVGGVYLGWMFATRSYATGTGTVGIRPEIVEKDMYFNEKMQALDYGLQVGASYEFLHSLRVGIRGVFGLISVFTPDFETVDRTVTNVYVHGTVEYVL